MNLWLVIVPACTLAVVWAVFREIREAERDPGCMAHRKQQRALREHHDQQERERKSATRWWKERGKIIKPNH